MPEATLYLIPCTLGDSDPHLVLTPHVLSVIHSLDSFIVENSKSARAFLKACQIPTPQQELIIKEIDKHNPAQDVKELLSALLAGKNTGLISEAGVPAVADPGSAIVKAAHQYKMKVVPLVGPSSILLALMSSGMIGQRFTFHGYLPFDKSDRVKALLKMEKDAMQQDATQIFIETPYRNNNLLKDITDSLNPSTRLSVAVSLTQPDEKIISQSIKDWKKEKADYHKKPAVFCIGVV
jgi:16S rRNA (cytidine1402-2'-O)-methyltransferase